MHVCSVGVPGLIPFWFKGNAENGGGYMPELEIAYLAARDIKARSWFLKKLSRSAVESAAIKGRRASVTSSEDVCVWVCVLEAPFKKNHIKREIAAEDAAGDHFSPLLLNANKS